MIWQAHGKIFTPSPALRFAQVPTVLPMRDKWRVYFAARTIRNKSFITYFDCAIGKPKTILYSHESPVLPEPSLGCFDEDGAMPSAVVRHEDKIYLYYTGWNAKQSAPYHNACGLAVSRDGGDTFLRAFQGPILDRNPLDPHMVVTPFVLHIKEKWHMWYVAGTGWYLENDKPEPHYLIKYAQSPDGLLWERTHHAPCIAQQFPSEAIANPAVFATSDGFHMWYSYRGCKDYRDGKDSYRLGYAQSHDGLTWDRQDPLMAPGRALEPWEKHMQAYPYVIAHAGLLYLFYNGNSFGRQGIGYMTLPIDDLPPISLTPQQRAC